MSKKYLGDAFEVRSALSDLVSTGDQKDPNHQNTDPYEKLEIEAKYTIIATGREAVVVIIG